MQTFTISMATYSALLNSKHIYLQTIISLRSCGMPAALVPVIHLLVQNQQFSEQAA